MSAQVEEFGRMDETKFSPLSVLWLLNHIGLGGSSDLSGKFIEAILTAEIPLYYINEDFDCENAFEECRLSEKTCAEARMQISYADCEPSDANAGNNWSEYFPSSLCNEAILKGRSVPLWFGANVLISSTDSPVVKTDEVVGIESLLVKVFDVKSACGLQGIGRFCWPTEHPLLHADHLVDYKLLNGMWQRAPAKSDQTEVDRVSKSALLSDQRIACVLAALQKHHLGSIQLPEESCATRLPPVKQIYRWVSSDSSFSKHGDPGCVPISYSTFNQLWKERLRDQVQARLSEQG